MDETDRTQGREGEKVRDGENMVCTGNGAGGVDGGGVKAKRVRERGE